MDVGHASMAGFVALMHRSFSTVLAAFQAPVFPFTLFKMNATIVNYNLENS